MRSSLSCREYKEVYPFRQPAPQGEVVQYSSAEVDAQEVVCETLALLSAILPCSTCFLTWLLSHNGSPPEQLQLFHALEVSESRAHYIIWRNHAIQGDVADRWGAWREKLATLTLLVPDEEIHYTSVFCSRDTLLRQGKVIHVPVVRPCWQEGKVKPVRGSYISKKSYVPIVTVETF